MRTKDMSDAAHLRGVTPARRVLDRTTFVCAVARFAEVVVRTGGTALALDPPSRDRLRAAPVTAVPDVNELSHLSIRLVRFLHRVDQALRTHIGPVRLDPVEALL